MTTMRAVTRLTCILAVLLWSECATRVKLAPTVLTPPATLPSWEQGRRHPEGPARALLRVAVRSPKIVVEALAS